MSELTEANSHLVECGLRLPREVPSGLTASNPVFTHPDQVVSDRELSPTEKHEILASWASDTRAIVNEPGLRQLDSGAVVRVEEIFRALRSLDKAELRHDVGSESSLASRPPFARRTRRGPRIWRNGRLRWDSPDDDPPPGPARAPVPNHGPAPYLVVAAASAHLASAA